MESYPWLLFKKGKDCRNQIFFNERMLEKAHHIKAILPCCSLDWLFILEELGQCCLWNPASLESVQLPSLTLETNQNIGYSILSLSPGNPDSLIVIFVRMEPLVIFCRVGDQRWIKQSVRDSCEDDTDFLTNPVCCNGKIYAMNFRGNRLLVIDRNLPDRLVIHLRSIPYRDDHSNCYSAFLVESCGEIFIIYLVRGGKLFLEVIGVAILKLDLALMEWTKVESAKDRVFFWIK